MQTITRDALKKKLERGEKIVAFMRAVREPVCVARFP